MKSLNAIVVYAKRISINGTGIRLVQLILDPYWNGNTSISYVLNNLFDLFYRWDFFVSLPEGCKPWDDLVVGILNFLQWDT